MATETTTLTTSAADRLDILALFARYSWTIDSGDVDAFAALFTPDAVQGARGSGDRRHGREEIRAWIKGRTEGDAWKGTQHQIGQVVFEAGDSERCVVRSYCLIVHRDRNGASEARTLWQYRNVCVKQDGEWVIAERLWDLWEPDKVRDFGFEP